MADQTEQLILLEAAAEIAADDNTIPQPAATTCALRVILAGRASVVMVVVIVLCLVASNAFTTLSRYSAPGGHYVSLVGIQSSSNCDCSWIQDREACKKDAECQGKDCIGCYRECFELNEDMFCPMMEYQDPLCIETVQYSDKGNSNSKCDCSWIHDESACIGKEECTGCYHECFKLNMEDFCPMLKAAIDPVNKWMVSSNPCFFMSGDYGFWGDYKLDDDCHAWGRRHGMSEEALIRVIAVALERPEDWKASSASAARVGSHCLGSDPRYWDDDWTAAERRAPVVTGSAV